MNFIKKYWLWAIVVLLLVGLTYQFFIKPGTAKHNENKFKIDPQYAEYVSAITTGIISCESTIKVVLVNPFQGDSADKEKVLDGIFKFKPGIDGKARWMDERTIEFIPEKKLKSGTLYEAIFNLKRVTKVPDNLKELPFAFQIINQNFMITQEGLQTYPGQSVNYFLIGMVRTADVIDNEEIEKVLLVNLEKERKTIKWEHSEDRKMHKFRIDTINRGESEKTLSILWDGNNIDIDNKGELNVEIPSVSNFKVIEARLIHTPEQYIKIIFSDPLNTSQMLDGFIQLSNGKSLRFSIEDNLVKAYPEGNITGENITLTVDEGILNTDGKKLPESFTKDFVFKALKPEVELIGKGVIMPNSDGLILPFRAVNLNAVDVTVVKIFENNIPQFLQVNSLDGVRELKRVGREILKQRVELIASGAINYGEWNNFSIDLSKLIDADPGAIYRVTLSIKKAYSLYGCGESEQVTNEETIATENWDSYEEEGEQSYWDYADDYYYDEYDGGYGDDYWENRDNPCNDAYYGSRRSVSRNVLASNFGVIAKLNKNNDVTVIVTDIRDASPWSGVDVELYDFQQQLMSTSSTNSDGIATLSAPHKPYLIIVKKDKERGYVTFQDGRSLSLSTFDIGGDEVQKGIKGFIYGERGVWRPGDSIFLTFILEDKNDKLPIGHPIIFELIDPQGKQFKRLVKSNDLNGFYSFIVKTEDNSPTGDWIAKVKAGGANFTKTLKVEAIKPNRLEIKFDFGKDILTSDDDISSELIVKWLHGAVAQNLEANVKVTLTKSSTSFAKYADFVFDDPSVLFNPEEQVVFDGRLNSEGVASVPISLSVENQAPGMLKANFMTKVFEEGGDFSVDYTSIPFSPFSTFVGIKLPKGDAARGMLLTDTLQTVQVVTVDPSGKAVSRTGLVAELYKVEWRWWWQADNDDLANYMGSYSHSPIVSKTISTVNGKGQFTFRVNYPEWGRYLVKVKDSDGHSSAKTVYIDWPGWAGKAREDNPGGATMLEVVPDKAKYIVGEKAVITVPTGKGGRALVSVESGSRIISMFWSEVKEGDQKRSLIEIPITEEMAPNVFVNVTLLQPHKKSENDMPIRLYGYTPILVENPSTKLAPEIKMPDVIGSEELVTLKIKEKNGKPMTYTIAIVDEGLLGITRFKTPDPHSTFYAREALGIKTWDMYDLLFGAFGGKIEQTFGIGGDEELMAAKGDKNAERFKPVVKFMGPFELIKGKENAHTFKLPKYIGAVRTMVVAGQDGAYGWAEKNTKVKNALMVMATLPRVLGPGESVSLPVTVFADDPSIKNVSIEVQPNNFLQITDAKSKSLSFGKSGGQQNIEFQLKVAQRIGIAKVKVIAKSGKYTAEYDIELDVRNSNPPQTNTIGSVLQQGQAWEQEVVLPGMLGTNSAFVELSAIPPINLEKRLKYLIQYPHGCIEQTTSSVFPQLYLNDIMDLSPALKIKTEENIKAGINRIKLFQQNEGGLSYWPGLSDPDDWATNYGGHFMLEAEKMGYELPAGFKRSLLKYQKKRAQNWPQASGYNSSDELTQAYRLYLLALAGEPELGAMNRLRERSAISIQSKWRLAAAYQLAGQNEAATELINNLGYDVKPYNELAYTYGSDTRDMAMILETMTLMEKYDLGFKIAEMISKELSQDDWYSTQSTAYCLIAMSQFATKSSAYAKEINANITIDGVKKESVSVTKSIFQLGVDVADKTKVKVLVQNKGKNILYASVISRGTPVAGKEVDAQNNLSIQINYKDLKGNSLDVSKIKQGTDFKAEVTISNPGLQGFYKNLAITQIIPSGWEIINMRMAGSESAHSKDVPDYQDIKDDRILTYFDLPERATKTFVIMLNASYQGMYYLPGVSCDAMYDNRINARKAGQWIEVVK